MEFKITLFLVYTSFKWQFKRAMRLHRICQKIGVWKSHCNFLFLAKALLSEASQLDGSANYSACRPRSSIKAAKRPSALKSSTMTTTSSLCSLKFLNKWNLGKIHLLPECFYFIFPALQMEQRSFAFLGVMKNMSPWGSASYSYKL